MTEKMFPTPAAMPLTSPAAARTGAGCMGGCRTPPPQGRRVCHACWHFVPDLLRIQVHNWRRLSPPQQSNLVLDVEAACKAGRRQVR